MLAVDLSVGIVHTHKMPRNQLLCDRQSKELWPIQPIRALERLGQKSLNTGSRRGPSRPTAGVFAACEHTRGAVLRYGHDGDGRHSGASFCTISTSHYAEYALVESDPRGRSLERHGASTLGITRPVAGGTTRGWNHMGICGHFLAGAANLYRNTTTSRAEAPDGALPRAELDSCQQCQRSHRRDGYPTLPQSGGSVRLWDGIHGCYCSRSGH